MVFSWAGSVAQRLAGFEHVLDAGLGLGFFSSSTNRRRSTVSSQASSTRLPLSTSPPHSATAAARATW
jgi:hypothetical protein